MQIYINKFLFNTQKYMSLKIENHNRIVTPTKLLSAQKNYISEVTGRVIN